MIKRSLNDIFKQRTKDRAQANAEDKPGVKDANEQRKLAQQKKWALAKTVDNLANGGMLIPKPEALIGGLDELADRARASAPVKRGRGRPRKIIT